MSTMKNYEEFRPFDDIDGDLRNEFKFWNVTEQGDVTLKDRRDIHISSSDLLNQNWLNHILRKQGYHANTRDDLIEFYFAFTKALLNAGYKSITLNLEHPEHPIVGEKKDTSE